MPTKSATPLSVSFDAVLQKESKRFGVMNEPDNDDGSPKGIVYVPKHLWDQIDQAKSVTVTITPNK